jgi:hypothetical protein
LFLLPANNASLGSAAPYFLPKAEGCSGDAPFCFFPRGMLYRIF